MLIALCLLIGTYIGHFGNLHQRPALSFLTKHSLNRWSLESGFCVNVATSHPHIFDSVILLCLIHRSPAMSNAPSQRRVSQTQPSAESWHSVPSHHTSASSSGNNDPQSNDRAGSPEVIVDLTSGHALDHGRDSDASVYRVRSGEKRKCWICLIEEGETLSNGNPMNTSRWAKACACSLDAHESCLITWINQSRGGDANKTVVLLTLSSANLSR
jgi:hypothetical protein